jgi:hypothetical protein
MRLLPAQAHAYPRVERAPFGACRLGCGAVREGAAASVRSRSHDPEAANFGESLPMAYVGSADFWNRRLQNWQSEFLAMVTFSIYLRQRGSPESKPVGVSHTAGIEG